MVIGEQFAWGHLEKTGGDATVDFFMAVPELVRFADPPSSPEKHCRFDSREPETRGKVLALNIRRLPAWVLSRALHVARYGTYPDWEPLSMPSPQQMAERSDGDQRLSEFTGDGKLKIDRWLRTEFLGDDFLAFISEFIEVPESKRREILELAHERRGTPLQYDHDLDHWFSRDQIRTMYENNPAWSALERQLYGSLDLCADGRAGRSKSNARTETAAASGTPSPAWSTQHRRRRSHPVPERDVIARKAQRFFDERWRRGNPSELEASELDQSSHARQIELLADRRYGRVLQLGCGGGSFTLKLAPIADHVVAVDMAPLAIARARALGLDPATVDFRVANIMDYNPRVEGPWDLVVMNETIYDLGWLYPLFDVGWLASELFAATNEGGRFLMANTYGAEKEYLLRPWLIDSYRDLFLNVGYHREAEEILRGTKDTVEYEILITLFSKPAESTARSS